MNAQVMRVLMVFGVLRLISASTDALRRGRAASTHRLNLRVELQRLVALRALRLRLLVVYLVLPILFLFLEVQVSGDMRGRRPVVDAPRGCA